MKQELLPMSSVPGRCIAKDCDHTKHAEADKGLIKPGQSAILTCWPTRPVTPCVLSVDASCAPYFDITEVRVGNRSMNPVAQSIPAVRFASRGDRSADATATRTFGAKWVLDGCDNDTPLVMYITNTSGAPRVFSCGWMCEDAPGAPTKYLVHSSVDSFGYSGGHGGYVGAGKPCTLIVRPQQPGLKPRHLWIDPESAQHFEIEDVLVGNCTQFPQTGAIPAARFADGAAFACNEINVAQDFLITVRNVSDSPQRFVGVWACDFTEEEHRSLHQGMSDLDVDRIADAVTKKMRLGAADSYAVAKKRMGDDALLLSGATQRDAAQAALDAFREVDAAEADRRAQPWVVNDISIGNKDVPKINAGGTIDHFVTYATPGIGDTMNIKYEEKPGEAVVGVEPAPTIDSAPDRREPPPDRKAQRPPPGFGWDPYSGDE